MCILVLWSAFKGASKILQQALSKTESAPVETEVAEVVDEEVVKAEWNDFGFEFDLSSGLADQGPIQSGRESLLGWPISVRPKDRLGPHAIDKWWAQLHNSRFIEFYELLRTIPIVPLIPIYPSSQCSYDGIRKFYNTQSQHKLIV